MKSYKEFISLVERYYEPDEVLPSGKTPYGKARSSFSRQTGEYKRTPVQSRTKNQADRLNRQTVNLFTKVKRGADNPNFDLSPSRNYEVDGDASKSMNIKDPNTGVVMKVRRSGIFDNKERPIYDISWKTPVRTTKPREALRSTLNIWNKEVVPRMPSNSTLMNHPTPNKGDRDVRGNLYTKFAKFQYPPHEDYGQFVHINRTPSPKQQNKGVTRNQPIDKNFDLLGNVRRANELNSKYRDSDRREEGRLRSNKLFSYKPRQTSPRVIAKAKLPYRPTLAPSKVASNKISKIRPRGRVGIVASLAAAGLGALSASRQQQKAKQNK